MGKQPMPAEDNSVAIIFNGEIYGYRDLREGLSAYAFRTNSDTEVILALYQKYGRNLAAHLPGMFSFGIWNDKEQELICARDRFGEKPFFYALGSNGEFVFASEIKALLASGIIEPMLSRRSLAHYLRRGYVHPTRTIYENIYTLPPAHFLQFSNGKIQVERYWQLPERFSSLSLSDAVEKFKELLSRAVERQLIADVEVGAFLSGGLDSTTLVTLATRKLPRLKTYSFGFSKGYSELPYARAVAEQCATQHVELFEEGHDIGELLVRMQGIYDEPFSDSAMIPTYLICKLARRYGKVVLTGEGADELLGGYQWWYRRSLMMERERHTSAWVFPTLFAAAAWERLRTLRRASNSDTDFLSRKWRDRWRGVRDWYEHGSIIKEHQAQTTIFGCPESAELGLDNYPDEAAVVTRSWEPSNTSNDALRMDVEDFMAGDILVKTDRASMAHGLELRAPFLDVDFASFCLSLPSNLKVTKRADKLILREAFADQWPEMIKSRPKQGFGASLDDWIQYDSIQDLKREYLDNPQKKVFELISFDASHRFAEGNSRKTWLLLVLALWAETHSFSTSPV
jgi:asparagine synthase (glutamine-hydrolysing)